MILVCYNSLVPTPTQSFKRFMWYAADTPKNQQCSSTAGCWTSPHWLARRPTTAPYVGADPIVCQIPTSHLQCTTIFRKNLLRFRNETLPIFLFLEPTLIVEDFLASAQADRCYLKQFILRDKLDPVVERQRAR
jgi:hypothetical protein